MHLGIAHHYGWAIAVTASADHSVVDRRRIELIEPGLLTAPVHHEGGLHPMHGADPPLGDDELAALVAEVRSSVTRSTAAALDQLAAELPAPLMTLSLRHWPADFPADIATQRRAPHESRADSIMYLQVLAEYASDRGWAVHLFDARTVEQDARSLLGDRAESVLHGPRTILGPPWSKDHRVALAATVLASRGSPETPPVTR